MTWRFNYCGPQLAVVSLWRVEETSAQYVRRLAHLYWSQTIGPRLTRPRQLRLPLVASGNPGDEAGGTAGAVWDPEVLVPAAQQPRGVTTTVGQSAATPILTPWWPGPGGTSWLVDPRGLQQKRESAM